MLGDNTSKHEHVKHILLRIQYLRELISLTPSSQNVADALPKNAFTAIPMISIRSLPQAIFAALEDKF